MEDEGKKTQAKAIQELLGLAQHEGNRAREMHEKFEALRDRIIDNIDFEDAQHAEAMRGNLEAIFNYGHSAGEASETSIAIREQIEIMHKMEKTSATLGRQQFDRILKRKSSVIASTTCPRNPSPRSCSKRFVNGKRSKNPKKRNPKKRSPKRTTKKTLKKTKKNR